MKHFKLKLFALLFCFFALHFVNAQDINATKLLLNRSEMAIYKSQKEMISGNSTKKLHELFLAAALQDLAIKAFAENNLKQAIRYSLKSREFTNSILENVTNNKTTYFYLNAEELQLATQSDYNKSDESYKTNLPSENSDESILLNPGLISKTFNLHTN